MRSIEVIQSFEKIINWAGERNKVSIDYGTGEKLCMSEIHLLEQIGKKKGILQMNLCEQTGLTKGRISVIIAKLIKKGMVIRIPNCENKRELPLMLSEKGMIAYENHQIRDRLVFQKMEQILDRYDEEEIEHFNEATNEILEILKSSKK